MKNRFEELLKKDFVILDGAMGTVLQKQGFTGSAEQLNLTDRARIEAIHKAYAESGSEIIYANSFGANRISMKKDGTEEIVTQAVLAVKNACPDCLAAVDIGPTGKMLEPMGDLSFEKAYESFAEIAVSGEKAGADIAVIETMTDLAELRCAILAVKENTSLPIIATMSFEPNGYSFTGCSAVSMAVTLQGLGVSALGINCSHTPAEMYPVMKAIAQYTDLPLIAKLNAGMPDSSGENFEAGPEEYTAQVIPYVQLGAKFIGGCCGTSPEYIKCVKKALEKEKPAVRCEAVAAVCSARQTLEMKEFSENFEGASEELRKALLSAEPDEIAEIAIEEETDYIELALYGERAKMLPETVNEVQALSRKPLVLSCDSEEYLEKALRCYVGRAAVKAAEEIKDKILPICEKYGAVIL